MSSAVVAVAFGHDLEHHNFAVDVINHDSFVWQLPIKCLLFRYQRAFSTLFVQYFAVGMIRHNAMITAVHLGRKGLTAAPVLFLSSDLAGVHAVENREHNPLLDQHLTPVLFLDRQSTVT